jgi:acyl-CoA dehydrogenase
MTELRSGTVSHRELRLQVREHLRNRIAEGAFEPSCDSWLSGFSPEFSHELGRKGWLGITWPKKYGGHGLSQLHRFAVTEELLAAGAPVAAHWAADRQSGPAILQFGNERQKLRFLPEIAAGRCYFAIGMSEPDSGSDLASVRTSAKQADDGGWLINGRKLWTSHAHNAHYMIALCRTAPAASDRRAGLSQFIVDLRTPGLQVNPVLLIDGGHHFNEVVIDDIHVGADAMLGAKGDGWTQVTRELVFERGGPERFLSTYPLIQEAIARAADTSVNRKVVGSLIAELWCLRQLAIQIVTGADDNQPSALNAAITKEIGTRLEQSIIEQAALLVQTEADPSAVAQFERLLAQSVLHAPGFTLRGGTNEVLRSVIAKMGGLR